jgi:enamine deaminase RidA (YjgF/YER057c/UK114 family)
MSIELRNIESRVAELQLELPPAPQAIGLYRPVVTVGSLVYTSGHGPLNSDGTFICGRVGETLATEPAHMAARQTGLAMLASLRNHCGSLDRVERLVKTTGMVCCTPDYRDQPAVINGFSELMRDLFGDDRGVAARSAFGVTALPAGWVVEIEAVFELSATSA